MAMLILGVTVSNQTSGIYARLGRECPVVISFIHNQNADIFGSY